MRGILRPNGWLTLGPLVLLPLGCLGCEKPAPPQQITDTEGRVFEATCKENRCKLVQRSGPVAEARKTGTGTEPRLMTPSRLVAVCDVKAGSSASQAPPPDACRPIVCESDENCPMLADGVVRATCLGKLCVEPVAKIRTADAIMLCLAGTGLGRSTGQQAERYALGLNCGSPCKVPTACRQP